MRRNVNLFNNKPTIFNMAQKYWDKKDTCVTNRSV